MPSELRVPLEIRAKRQLLQMKFCRFVGKMKEEPTMKKRTHLLWLVTGLLSLMLSVFSYSAASAHESITVGSYTVEIGWLEEPPVVGQRNAIIVNIAKSGEQTPTAVDISGLKVAVVYGGQSKTLELQPLSEDSVNQYTAAILPAIPGKYTVRLSGTIGADSASADVQPEEVQAADVLLFPKPASANGQATDGNLSTWVAGAALLLGAAALLLSVLNWLKTRR